MRMHTASGSIISFMASAFSSLFTKQGAIYASKQPFCPHLHGRIFAAGGADASGCGTRIGVAGGGRIYLTRFPARLIGQHPIEHFPIDSLPRRVVFVFHFHTYIPAWAGSPYSFLPVSAKYIGRFRPQCSICDEMRGDTKSVRILFRLQTLLTYGIINRD